MKKKVVKKKAMTPAQKIREANKRVKESSIELAASFRRQVELETQVSELQRDIKLTTADVTDRGNKLRVLNKVLDRVEESLRSRHQVIRPEVTIEKAVTYEQQEKERWACFDRCDEAPMPLVPDYTEECRLIEYLLHEVICLRHESTAKNRTIGGGF